MPLPPMRRSESYKKQVFLFNCFPGISFFFYFFYRLSQAIRDKRLQHLISIFLWCGVSIALINNIAPFFLSTITLFISTLVLLVLLRIAPLLTKMEFLLPPLNPKLKSHQRFKKLQEEKVSPADLYSCSLINEYILWVLVMYRSVITIMAALMP